YALPLLPEQLVQRRRFSDTRRSQQRHRATRTDQLTRRPDSARRAGADRNDLRVAGDLACFRRAGFELPAKVGLVEYNGRLSAALSGQRQVSLDTSWIEVMIEAADDQSQIDVGGDDLLLFALSGRAPREDCPPRKYRVDHGFPRSDSLNRYPIAHGG